MIDWLKKNKKYLSINAIGEGMRKEYGMHPDILHKAISGSRTLPAKWENPLNEFINKIFRCWGK